jgi:hypothetical protein
MQWHVILCDIEADLENEAIHESRRVSLEVPLDLSSDMLVFDNRISNTNLSKTAEGGFDRKWENTTKQSLKKTQLHSENRKSTMALRTDM